MRTFLLAAPTLLLALAFFFAAPRPATAQSVTAPGIQVEDNTAVAAFGVETRELRFGLRARSEERIRNVALLYQVDDSQVQNSVTPVFQPGTAVTAAYLWRVQGALLPGSEVKYQWQLETESGQKHTTPLQSVTYADTRFRWREQQVDQVVLSWHDADGAVSQALIDEARSAQAKLRTEHGLALERPVKVYVYARAQDFASVVSAPGRQLAPAMSFGGDRIFVIAQPGAEGLTSATSGLRQEIAAALFAQKTNNPYGPAPRWLSEGFALVVSGELISDNNARALRQFAENNRLLPLKALNTSFPTTDNEFALARAESQSVVKFMFDTYGAEKVRATLAAFKEGNTVDDGLRKGLGVSLDQLETRWKNALKSGNTARAPSRPGAAPVDVNDWAARIFGVQALQYWQGIFGPNARWVMLGGAAFMGLGLVAVIAGSVIGAIRKAHRETEDL
ncbi:MAG TPA: peptidase MA family metallohydrolase [Chloroflexota bacterium]|nr:peptidase MA family metallohydrolase [Chloroflexota bacterium]